jgi:hypothetical protein
MTVTSLQTIWYDRVLDWLRAEFIDIRIPDPHQPVVVLTQGSAATAIEVRLWQGTVMLAIWTYVVTDAQLQPSLLQYLLRQNELLRFGGFSLDGDGDIRLQANLYGTSITAKELIAVASEVLAAADLYDDEIIQIWGGKRAIDHLVSFTRT